MSRDDSDVEKGAAALLIVMFVSNIAVWLGLGWILWKWIHVDSFYSGVIFMVAWGIIGGMLSTFISTIITLILKFILSIFLE